MDRNDEIEQVAANRRMTWRAQTDFPECGGDSVKGSCVAASYLNSKGDLLAWRNM
jgi:hypothetical protein